MWSQSKCTAYKRALDVYSLNCSRIRLQQLLKLKEPKLLEKCPQTGSLQSRWRRLCPRSSRTRRRCTGQCPPLSRAGVSQSGWSASGRRRRRRRRRGSRSTKAGPPSATFRRSAKRRSGWSKARGLQKEVSVCRSKKTNFCTITTHKNFPIMSLYLHAKRFEPRAVR